MEIFVRGIPSSSTRRELKQFVQRGMRRRLPIGPKPFLVSYNILKITDANGRTEYHGLVEVQPEKAARALIRRLNGKMFKGRVVEVRPFYKRKGMLASRREAVGKRNERVVVNRRLGDRRRADLKIEKRIAAKLSVPYKGSHE